MSHNLEYLLTRPGALKIATVVLGIVASILNSDSYANSEYTRFYLEEVGRGNSSMLPGTEFELSNMSSTLIFLGLSFLYLAAHALFYSICESRLNKFVDTAFHFCGALFLFAGGTTLIHSAVQIERSGCDAFQSATVGPHPNHSLPLTTILSSFQPGQNNSQSPLTENMNDMLWDLHEMSANTCHHFAEKIVGGIFNIVNGILYGLLGFIVFTTEVEEM